MTKRIIGDKICVIVLIDCIYILLKFFSRALPSRNADGQAKVSEELFPKKNAFSRSYVLELQIIERGECEIPVCIAESMT